MPVNALSLTGEAVLRALGVPDAFGGSPGGWDAAMAALPAGRPDILAPAAVSARRVAAGLPPEHDAPLCALAAEVAGDAALLQFFWYLHWLMFVAAEHHVPWGAPTLEQRLGARAGLFYQLLALEFPPRLADWHRQLGYPPEVTSSTIRQIRVFDGNHRRGMGQPGLYARQCVWLAAYLTKPYVRLGRLEYCLQGHYGPGAWRRRADGFVLALADAGVRVGDDGLCLGADAPPDAGWTTTLVESPDGVAGYPIDPAGRILRRQMLLAGDRWTPCLRKDDTILDIHIPAGGGLEWAAVCDSVAQALAFFPRHHPDRPFAALACRTWFLDPQLADLLEPDANVLRFQRAVYLTPIQPDPGGLWFVFLRDAGKAAAADLPRETRLQRVLADFLARGGRWHGGSMFIMREDAAELREGRYRERFAAGLSDSCGISQIAP